MLTTEELLVARSAWPELPLAVVVRQSPASDAADRLQERGREVQHRDPFVRDLVLDRAPAEYVALTAVNPIPEGGLVVITKRGGYYWKWIAERFILAAGTRSVCDGLHQKQRRSPLDIICGAVS